MKTLLLTAFAICLQVRAYVPPTMGWSSWNTYRVNINEELIKKQADAMKATGLQDAGYTYINIDDGFFGGRDKNGNIKAHATRFPNGLKPVADYIHSLGFKAGIYSDAGRNTCGNFWDNDVAGQGVGFLGHDQQDADFYFKQMGFDFIKIDFCGGDAKQNSEHLDLDERERYSAIRKAIDDTGRKDVRINVCRWAFPGTWVHEIGSSWRISPDIQNNWNSIKSILAKNRYLSAYATEGHFNDMDMLEIGRSLTEAEERSHFGMWCIQSSPLLIGCDMTTIPPRSLELLKNKELIALNQDQLALQAYVVKVEQGAFLYVKDVETLNGNTRAVAVFNPTETAVDFSFKLSDIDLKGDANLRDLFKGKDLERNTTGTITLNVQPHDTRILKITAEQRIERSVYEAETAWLQRYQDIGMNQNLGYANYSEAAGCSGGAKVGWLGNHAENYLEWRNVYSEKGGIYDLTLSYVIDQHRQVYCSINSGEAIAIDCPAGSMDKPQDMTIKIVLKPGMNTVRLYNNSAWCPDIDKMALTSTTSTNTGILQTMSKDGGKFKTLKLYNDGQLMINSEFETTASLWNAEGVKLRTLQLHSGNNNIGAMPQGIYYVLQED